MLTLDYASNQTARRRWRPILFLPSKRSLLLLLLTAANILGRQAPPRVARDRYVYPPA